MAKVTRVVRNSTSGSAESSTSCSTASWVTSVRSELIVAYSPRKSLSKVATMLWTSSGRSGSSSSSNLTWTSTAAFVLLPLLLLLAALRISF